MSKQVIIETGGKQYLVKEGDTLMVEKLAGHKVGDKVTFDKVLWADDGSKASFGAPYVSGLAVTAELVGEGRSKKVVVIRYRQKSRYFKKKGHRQPFSQVKIGKI